MYDPGSAGTLWWEDYTDTVRGHTTWGLLHRCRLTNTCPKIMETYGGPEMWYSHGSVGIAGTQGTEDLPLPDNVRRYYHPGTAHGGGAGGWNIGTKSTNPLSLATNPESAKGDQSCAAHRHDRMGEAGRSASAERVSARQRRYAGPGDLSRAGMAEYPCHAERERRDESGARLRLRPQFNYNDGSGVITNVPPIIKGVIPSLAPKMDADGNEIAGVKSMLFSMPLGTYTGWNPIASGPLKGREGSLASGYVPFPKTAAERIALGDPRLSVQERYGSLANYVNQSILVGKNLVARRLLLPQDFQTLVTQMKTQMAAGGLLP